MANRLPVVVGLTICRNVFNEGGIGEYSLTRAFIQGAVYVVPGPNGHVSVPPLASLIDDEGDVPFDLHITRYGDTIESLRHLRGVLQFQDRHQSVELVVRFPQFVFPQPGIDEFTLYVNGEWVAQRGIRVYRAGEEP